MVLRLPRKRYTRFVGLIAVSALCVVGCSSGDDIAGADGGDIVIEVASSAAALFDSSVVHTIDVSFDEADYDAMIATFTETGEKEWIEATVTIDGVTYPRAGLRLKGNSSLAGLGGGRVGGGGPSGSASAESPEELPWLIRLDEFVEGQEHQGYEDIVIRSNRSATSLNEALALELLETAGLASQQSVATSFRVNGGAAVLRLAIEHPDDDAWQQANFAGDGALYKAESTGDWSYRGDDPSSYEEVFDQEGGSDVTDLTPLIDFLEFINESDDATFAAELPDRLDVDAFATYLAMMDLVANFDDIDGPGNNAYLWYDVESAKFTIVPWDMNLAFGAQAGFGGASEGGPTRAAPGGVGPPAGQMPGEAPAAMQGGAGPGGRGSFGRSNVLVERFHANAEFEALYQEELAELAAALYDSGTAAEILAAWTEVLTANAADLVDAATIATEADAIAAQLDAG